MKRAAVILHDLDLNNLAKQSTIYTCRETILISPSILQY